jgi:DNA gyrase subunit A
VPETTERIIDLPIEQEMKQSYLTYAMSVIVSRALPDVRDGLKPSQRRILVAMNDLGLGPRAKYRKCAKIAGDTSGNYHPHGEAVIYPTLVRMAQPFNMRYPLVDGQGNFGSIDGDPPAAMRYTEARLTAVAMEMLADLEEETVDTVANYDETRQEPTVLPARFPNLLANGSSGIAVGMATSIPPHNVGELADALTLLLDRPSTPLEELIQRIPGPDFPTGGLICGRRGIEEAYRTGKSILTIRARTHIEDRRDGRKCIIATEIPFQANKAKIIEHIAQLIQDDRLDGVSDVRDESDREGMRIVVELKRGEDPSLVLNQLFERTELQGSFSVILLVLIDGRPRTCPLSILLQSYIDHRRNVIRRRTLSRLRKARERLHIVEGLRKAVEHIDELVRIIRKARDPATAKEAMIRRFEFSDKQAQAILQLQLQRLTGLERNKLDEEHAGLLGQIAQYRDILENERTMNRMLGEEFEKLKAYADPRRTEIAAEVASFTAEDVIADDAMIVTISHQGYIKRLSQNTYRRQHRGGVGVSGMGTGEGDFLERLFVATCHQYLLFFTDQGRAHWLKVYDIPELARQAKGRALVNLLKLQPQERIQSALAVRRFEEGSLLLATARGTVKKSPLRLFSRPKAGGIIAIRLEKGDQLIGAQIILPGQEILIATRLGYALRCPQEKVRDMGRGARGVRGISLRPEDEAVALTVVDQTASVLTLCEKGFGKRTPFTQYRRTNRGGKGVVNVKISEKNGPVVGVLSVEGEDEVMVVTEQGMVVRTDVDSIRSSGRATQGVCVISLREGDRVVSLAPLVQEQESVPEAGPRAPQRTNPTPPPEAPPDDE